MDEGKVRNINTKKAVLVELNPFFEAVRRGRKRKKYLINYYFMNTQGIISMKNLTSGSDKKQTIILAHKLAKDMSSYQFGEVGFWNTVDNPKPSEEYRWTQDKASYRVPQKRKKVSETV